MPDRFWDVIVVGAGLSGLSAAKLLNEYKVDVLVLEARDRVGGRTFTVHNPNVDYLDLGGAYVGPTQNRILRLAREFGVKTFLTNEVEDSVFYYKGKSKRFRSAFPPLGILGSLDMNNLFRLMDKMAEEIPMDAPWMAPHAKEWDNMTMQEFFNKVCWTKSVRRFANLFVNVNVTSEPYECSLLWFLNYIQRCGGVERILSTTNGGQERKFCGGSQQISIKMADRLGADRVLLRHPVITITQNSSEAVVKDITGREFRANFVILANPLPLQYKIIYDPPLPCLRNQLLQRIPMGSVIKTFMYYKRPFWREKGMCGSSAIDDDGALIGFTLDHLKPDGTHPALMGFILADKARRYTGLTKEERKNKIAELYSKVFQSEEALHPVHYEEKNWMEEQWSGGCYTAMMPPGFLTKFGKELRKPFGCLHFAGTETATEWSGYMEGAVQSGERAARERRHSISGVPKWKNLQAQCIVYDSCICPVKLQFCNFKILFNMDKIKENEIWKAEPEDYEVKARPFNTSFWERNLPSVPCFLRLLGFTMVLAASGAGAVIYIRCFK